MEQKKPYISDGALKAAGLPPNKKINPWIKKERAKYSPSQPQPLPNPLTEDEKKFSALDRTFDEVKALLAKSEAGRAKDEADHAAFLLRDAELEKKSNDEYEARKKLRDDLFEKNWGKNKQA